VMTIEPGKCIAGGEEFAALPSSANSAGTCWNRWQKWMRVMVCACVMTHWL
jgi:hypothetical protein